MACWAKKNCMLKQMNDRFFGPFERVSVADSYSICENGFLLLFCHFHIPQLWNYGGWNWTVRVKMIVSKMNWTRIGNRFSSLDCWHSPTKSLFSIINLRVFFSFTLVPIFTMECNKSNWAIMEITIFLDFFPNSL